MSRKYKLKAVTESQNHKTFDKHSFLLATKSNLSLKALSYVYFMQWRMQKHNKKEKKNLKEKQEE